MADKNTKKAVRLQRRKFSGRKGLFGSPERPRLVVFRSSKHIYAQLVDDYAGKTLAYAGTSSGEDRGPELKTGANVAAAKVIGKTRSSWRRASRPWSSTATAISSTAASRPSPTPPAKAAYSSNSTLTTTRRERSIRRH